MKSVRALPVNHASGILIKMLSLFAQQRNRAQLISHLITVPFRNLSKYVILTNIDSFTSDIKNEFSINKLEKVSIHL